jgi:hypothetical protein
MPIVEADLKAALRVKASTSPSATARWSVAGYEAAAPQG